MSTALDAVASIKVKLGLLVAASVVAAVLLTLLGSAAHVSPLLVLPVSVALALGVTQLLAAGMVAPLRRMTEVTRAMARGDYSGRVRTTATDEVGQLAAAFNRMAEDLATVDRERRDLIATVSHELRTPLTAMTALLENLADGVVPADPDHLAAALDEAQRLGRLVDDLLQLSRLEAGVVELDRDDLALRPLLGDTVAQLASAGRPGSFHVDVPGDLTVLGDAARLRQLFVNVLDNAGRHAPAGTVVRVTGRRRGRQLVGRGRRRRRGSGPRGPGAGLRPVRHRRSGRHRARSGRRAVGGPAPRRHDALPRPGRRARCTAPARRPRPTAHWHHRHLHVHVHATPPPRHRPPPRRPP